MRSFATLAVLVSLLSSSTRAWWGNGHMIVARIAYDKLLAETPDLLTRAEGVLAEYQEYTTLEQNHTFVECATFADVIKSKGWGAQSHWHYEDNPYLDEGYSTEVYPELYNVTWALDEMIYSLKYAKPETGPLTYPTVSYIIADSFNLRLLVHYVGDVHQPLHATTRYTSKYPDGDEGGNYFKLSSKDSVSNLHSLWDSVLYEYSDDMSLPLSDADWQTLGDQATRLTGLYPESSFSNLNNDFTTWADESFEFAKSFVYENITENTLPSDEYIAAGKTIAEQRLALAGYRLALTLQNLWGVSTTKSFLQ